MDVVDRSDAYTFRSLTSTGNETPYGCMKSESIGSLTEAETSIADPKNVKRRVRHHVRSARVNSAYTPHNRLSRYKTALNSIIPFRAVNTGTTDLPVDNVGCISNSSFAWIRKFIISPSQLRNYQSLPTNSRTTSQSDIFLLPKRPYSDSCEINCRRLLGIYKDEETLKGRKRISMFKVTWRFVRTRLLIASLFHCLAILLTFLGVALFSNLTVESMQTVVAKSCQNCAAISNCSNAPSAILEISFEMNRNTCNSTAQIVPSDGLGNRLLLSLGLFLCYLSAMIFIGVRNWLNLRTAIRLRTAVLSSIYKRVMKSSIANCVSAHQIMTAANEESDAILQIVEALVQLIGVTFGFLLAFLTGFILLPFSGMLPLLGILPLLLLLLTTGNVSKKYYRKFVAYGANKISILEDICTNFKNVKSLQFESIFVDWFLTCLHAQYNALQWSIVYAAKFSGGVTSALLVGGLYLIWCDTNIKTESTEVLILLLIFAHHVQKLVLDFCNCVHILLRGNATLDKLKQCYQLSMPDNVRLKPSREHLVIQVNNVEASWTQDKSGRNTQFRLHLENFEIVRGQIIGVTGSSGGGKTTLLHTILRNTEVQKGKVLQRGKMAYFPSKPVLLNASVKDNVLFGEAMDPQRYYLATHTMMLNEDTLQAPGSDDIPIPYLELTGEQLERIALARAIYCHRQIVLLDEPLNCCANREQSFKLYLQMMNTFRQDNKTVILVTQFDEYLRYCDRVFRIENGTIYREGSYAEILNMPSHLEMTRQSNIETACRNGWELYEGSDPTGLNIANHTHFKVNRRSKRISDGSIEIDPVACDQLKHRKLLRDVRSFSPCDYIMLVFMHLINSLLYFGPIFTLVIIVEQGDINPWLSTICLGVIVCTFFMDNICKAYVARVMANRNKAYQSALLKALLDCSLTYLQTTSISVVLDLFSDIISAGFVQIDSGIHHALIVLFSAALLIIANYWAAFIVATLFVTVALLTHYLKYSLQHLYGHEQLSRRRMFSILTNHLAGRVVIQSYDHVSSFAHEFYSNVEENSTAIFMYKSIHLFAEFWLQFTAWFLCMPGLLLNVLLTPQSELSIHRYTLAMFSYLSLVHGLHKLIESILAAIVATKRNDVLRSNIMELPNVEIAQHTATLTESNIGLTVSFNDIVYRVANRKLLKISKLNVQGGETVAITGNGSKLIVPLLCRILSPSQGTVRLNQLDIAKLDVAQLRAQIGVIPANPIANGISIDAFLNEGGTFRSDHINDVLKEVKLFESIARLPNKLLDSVCMLPPKDRQLLCLARCCLRKPSLLMVEHIHPDICEIVGTAIRAKFIEQTVIIICSHEIQYRGTCEKLINLDEV
ncbi:ATP-binding cassette sub-family C member 11-like isoform X2 [Toxorhynchites rutilus septentrionalis]|uniref:ATP-binding cassette sub-family C member 11-like isoform X2 n=1 Tax=Toxorhynchites rutilus septentrionalis TaxID=329112 RepID=UPI0024792D8C|nr:ATP-binding cassette sub-family C member 11-like isoform X2 [Toxorhynchites rutilus septentrionalis]